MPWESNRETHVPTPLRNACLARDGHRCTAIRQDRARCPETTHLEAAHIVQHQAGESLTVDGLRTMCHWHHNLETQRQARAARKPQQRSDLRPAETHPALRRGRTPQ